MDRDIEGEEHAMDDDIKIIGPAKKKEGKEGTKKRAQTQTKEESTAKYSTQEVSPKFTVKEAQSAIHSTIILSNS
uniref:Uncharacterized protein n=1 Tax=Oryza punctata TaxID=4537 RepID=A0A0E0JVR7_ORYPU